MSEMQNEPKKRVLILSLAYFPFIGGAEVAVREITSKLSGDFKFDMVTARMNRDLAKREKMGDVDVYRIGFGWGILDKYIFTFFGFFKAFRLYLKNKYDIVWPIMAAYASYAVLFKVFTRVKVLLTIQEGDATGYIEGLKRFRIFKFVYRVYFKKVDRVQVISQFLFRWVKGLGVDEKNITIVPNGVGLKKFTRNEEKLKIRERLNLPVDAKIILTDSRLVKKNGVQDLIDAHDILIKQNKDLNLVIVGNGPLMGSYEFGEKERVMFIGTVDYENVQDYYFASDVFCRPSLSEGFGNVFIQAMAAELPVVATPVGGILDFLEHKETGWFAKVSSPKDLAEKINYVLDEDNVVEVDKVIDKAKKMVDEKYTWDSVALQMKEVFNKVLK